MRDCTCTAVFAPPLLVACFVSTARVSLLAIDVGIVGVSKRVHPIVKASLEWRHTSRIELPTGGG